jgi:hypothetical protein
MGRRVLAGRREQFVDLIQQGMANSEACRIAPIIGFTSEHVSPRGGLVVGGLACLVAAGAGATALSRGRTPA